MRKYNFYLKINYIPKLSGGILKEITEIKKAFKHADQVKSGKLKGRPANELLNTI